MILSGIRLNAQPTRSGSMARKDFLISSTDFSHSCDGTPRLAMSFTILSMRIRAW